MKRHKVANKFPKTETSHNLDVRFWKHPFWQRDYSFTYQIHHLPAPRLALSILMNLTQSSSAKYLQSQGTSSGSLFSKYIPKAYLDEYWTFSSFDLNGSIWFWIVPCKFNNCGTGIVTTTASEIIGSVTSFAWTANVWPSADKLIVFTVVPYLGEGSSINEIKIKS